MPIKKQMYINVLLWDVLCVPSACVKLNLVASHVSSFHGCRASCPEVYCQTDKVQVGVTILYTPQDWNTILKNYTYKFRYSFFLPKNLESSVKYNERNYTKETQIMVEYKKRHEIERS